jgi:hypothetical protein
VVYHARLVQIHQKGAIDMNELPKLYAKADMAARWGVTRQVVKNWEDRYDDFPKPVMIVGNGRMPLYLEKDVLEFEKKRRIKPKE